jgi:hypothetical protein
MTVPQDTRKPKIDRFRETARELDCDEDEAEFKEKLKVIERQKPKTVAPSPPKTAKP